MNDWTESTPVEALYQICLGFHFVCAAGKGVECLGVNKQGIREIYVIYSSSGVSLNSDGGVVIAYVELAVVENSSEVAVSELAY